MSLPITNLPIPNLDDRRFDDLIKEARSLILNYNKEWTNHNPSDPGITLLELFAWLSEMVIYRINQVPVESHINFIKLIAGTPDKGDPEKVLRSAYLFDWNDFEPDGDIRLRNFLKTELGIEWANIAKIKKDDTNKTLLVFSGKNRVEINLDEIEGKGYLKINGCNARYLHAIKENDKLNVYNVPDLDDAFKNLLTFLKDIDEGKKKSITEIKQAPVEFMESTYRAITSEDYENKAQDCMKILLQIDPPGRAVCMTNRKLLYSKVIKEYQVNEELPGHVSVIIIPRGVENTRYCEDEGKPTDRLLEEIKAYLDARRLITTRVHVVNPVYINFSLKVQLAIKQNIKQNEVVSEAGRKINEYFNPISGGPGGTGWPLGRHIYRSEVYNLLESIPGIDHVAKIEIDDNEDISTREILKHQLISLDKLDIETVSYE